MSISSNQKKYNRINLQRLLSYKFALVWFYKKNKLTIKTSLNVSEHNEAGIESSL